MFIRFTIGRPDERSGSEEGLFTVAYRELNNASLADYERDWLDELLAWFKKEVKIPGSILRRDANRRAICWFRESSREVVSKAFELVLFLRERGYHVETHRTAFWFMKMGIRSLRNHFARADDISNALFWKGNTMRNELKFVWDKYYWVSEAKLSSWAGFQNRSGAYGSVGAREASDGTVRIVFAPEGRGEEKLNNDERRLVEKFIEQEPEISKALLTHLVDEYPTLQQQYGYTGRDKKALMPDVLVETDFRKLIGLHTIHIHQVFRKGVPYAGYEFGCTWDDEHGLGILMNGTRPVKIGGADAVCTLWIARKDAGHG